MLNYSILQHICFWDSYDIKTKYEIIKIYVVKAKYKLLVNASLRFLIYPQSL